MDQHNEIFIAVDVEAAGPSPGKYSLLSLGACLVADPERHFYIELQPTTPEMDPETYAIHGLSLDRLNEYGLPPKDAMTQFEAWIHSVTPPEKNPIFVALNAPFDWMFVNDYFHRFLGRNPFGYAALDMKALFMGLTRLPWSQTNLRTMSEYYGEQHELTHHALRDAQDEALLFQKMLAHATGRQRDS